MKRFNPHLLGEGSTIAYPITGRCNICKNHSSFLYRVSKDDKTATACRKCLGAIIGPRRKRAAS